MNVELIKFPYKYMEYEKALLVRELEIKFPQATLTEEKDKIIMSDIYPSQVKEMRNLSYIESYLVNGELHNTRQAELEFSNSAKANSKRQGTRYSTHGLHEYKGKYNPQIVKGMLNILGVKDKAYVFDPFCGSGTTMLECAHYGMSSLGTDINPMAVLISNAKIKALKMNVDYVRSLVEKFSSNVGKSAIVRKGARYEYLYRWLPEDILNTIETLLEMCNQESDVVGDFLKITISNLIRDYSNQEPSDLRIRRRISPFPEMPFLDAWKQATYKQLDEIEAIQSLPEVECGNNYAIQHDIREKPIGIGRRKFDAIVTSPPYATALPYIDTQRISLVWLGLCDPEEIIRLESSLIGSREFVADQKIIWKEECENNDSDLPEEVYGLITSLKNSIGESDGFRKRAVPPLLYRYFSDMKKVFINTKPMVKKNGKFALVVGNNKTTLGGTKFLIDTPHLLSLVAENAGWKATELFPLQTYKRYGINSKNAINSETLIILTNCD